MKIPNKRQLQQKDFIDFKEFMSLYKKRTAKTYFFPVTHCTIASDNSLGFKKNLSERI